jgi:hypothetical protein
VFDKKYSEIQQMIDKEKDMRKKFLNDWGKILPVDFIPQLKD